MQLAFFVAAILSVSSSTFKAPAWPSEAAQRDTETGDSSQLRMALALSAAATAATDFAAVSLTMTSKQSAAPATVPETALDPLAGLPETELIHKTLLLLTGPEKRCASLVCRSWHAAVAQLPVSMLSVTTEQVSQPAFLDWLRQPGRAAQVRLSAECVTTPTARSSVLRGCMTTASPFLQFRGACKELDMRAIVLQVREFSVSAPEGCIGEVCMAVAETRRLLSCVTRYSDHVSQQASPLLPSIVKAASVACRSSARLSMLADSD